MLQIVHWSMSHSYLMNQKVWTKPHRRTSHWVAKGPTSLRHFNGNGLIFGTIFLMIFNGYFYCSTETMIKTEMKACPQYDLGTSWNYMWPPGWEPLLYNTWRFPWRFLTFIEYTTNNVFWRCSFIFGCIFVCKWKDIPVRFLSCIDLATRFYLSF